MRSTRLSAAHPVSRKRASWRSDHDWRHATAELCISGWCFGTGVGSFVNNNHTFISAVLSRFSLDVQTKILKESGEALAQAAQGGGGVTVPGGVQEMWRSGTEGCDLVVTDWMVSVIFSNFNISVTLWPALSAHQNVLGCVKSSCRKCVRFAGAAGEAEAPGRSWNASGLQAWKGSSQVSYWDLPDRGMMWAPALEDCGNLSWALYCVKFTGF